MPDEPAPSALLRLAPPQSYARKKRVPHFPPAPERNRREHAEKIRLGAKGIRLRSRSEATRAPDLVTDVPYVRISIADRAVLTDAEVRSLGLVPVFRREDSILAAYATDPRMAKLESQLKLYETDRKVPGGLSKIESFDS